MQCTIDRSSNRLKDYNNPVDRQIGMLYDPNNDKYLVGLAVGLSLVSGDTVKEKRNENCKNGSVLLSFSPANINKFYVSAVNTSPYESGYYPAGYFKEINYYVSYFDPAENVGQVYWYKDGDRYIIYCHCQNIQRNVGINVPDFMEGLGLFVIENTNGATLSTDTIQGGKFFVDYTTNEANYIVLSTECITKKSELDDAFTLKENDVYVSANTDSKNRLIEGVTKDGVKEIYVPIDIKGNRIYGDNIPGFKEIVLDNHKRVVVGIKDDGDVIFGVGVPSDIKDAIADKENKLMTVIGLLANSADNVALSNNKKLVSTIMNINTPKPVAFKVSDNNNINLKPRISIIDDDTIDNQIPDSRGISNPEEKSGGYFSVLLPFTLSLKAKHNKPVPVGVASEGHRIGLTPIQSNSDAYTSLNTNGNAVKWIHDNMGWNVLNHSMTAQLPMNAYYVDGIDSELAATILSEGTYSGNLNFYNTIVLDRLTGKWYEVNSTKTAWVERTPTKKYALPFYQDYVTKAWYFNRDFDFDYSWGEWFKRADALGLPYEKVIVHNGNTSSIWMAYAGRRYADFSIKTTGTHNYPPIAATVNRKANITGSTNVRNVSYENELMADVDKCFADNTWMVFMTHFNTIHHWNYYIDGETYTGKDDNYPAEWAVPLKYDEILDIIGSNEHDYINHPPSRLNISTWDEWYPAPGTQLKSFYDVLDYAMSKGIDIVTPVDGWITHGNIINLGTDRNGQTYPWDSAMNTTPLTDEEQSYLTIGADLSVRYFNKKSN
jgi:hypothetical protein